MHIEIHESVSKRPNGDRDTQRHNCYGFFVLLINEDKTAILFENNQYNVFWSSIQGTRLEYLQEAQKKAVEFSLAMGVNVDLEPKKLPDQITQVKKKIAALEDELARLENSHE